MYKHRRTHSGIRPYACVDCGKTYLSVSHLNKHRRAAHSTYRPFQCSFCGKCYKTKDQLTFHESSHRGEKPYQCEVCGYATAYRNTYYAHRKKHQTSLPSTSSPQKKDKDDLSSTTEAKGSGCKSNNVGKKGDKNRTGKGRLSSRRKSARVVSSETPLNTVAPRPLQIETTRGNVKPARCTINMSQNTTSVNVICVVSSEPTNTSVLSEGNTSISTRFPIHIDNQCKDIQSSESASFMSSEPLQLVQPTDTSSEEAYPASHQNTKPQSFELVTNSHMQEENLQKICEEQASCIILSNAAKCSFPMCDSGDESLLLFKVDDESYVALCTHHSLTNLTVDTAKESTPLKGIASVNISTHVLDSPSHENETAEQETSNSLALKVVTKEENICESETHCQNSPEQDEKQTAGGSSLIQLMSHSASTSETCVTSVPASQQIECVKPSSEVCLTEHLSTMMELDSGIASLSGPIVDESFSLTQMEVHCPLCEEHFLCMDYVTHLESCHN